VGKLPAYYAGSIYPKNFGETHKAGFNMVELTKAGSYGWNADVERVDFPHPQNLKIETSDPMSYEMPDGGINGKRVWLEITCSKEQKALISIDDELAQLRKLGAVAGSRVTVCDMPIETAQRKILVRFWYPIIDRLNIFHYNIIALSIMLGGDRPSL
jgi:hypothetical protein